jgi:glycosyltransferase involved in cell wall biosynthesis
MYAGLPIVATEVGSIPEIVKNGVNGFLVSPDNIQQICDCVSKLLKDSTLRKEIGIRNKQIAKSYTWSKVALSTNRLYQRLLGEYERK